MEYFNALQAKHRNLWSVKVSGAKKNWKLQLSKFWHLVFSKSRALPEKGPFRATNCKLPETFDHDLEFVFAKVEVDFQFFSCQNSLCRFGALAIALVISNLQ